MTDLAPKPMRNSRVSISQLMQPEYANTLGNVHGGWIMKLVDECGALACMRHSQRRVVTVALDGMRFHQPIRIGDLVTLTAEVTYTGRTSIEAEVLVIAENPLIGIKTHTNNAYVVYVALDDSGAPVEIPQVYAENSDEQARLDSAKQRQILRLKK
jgi:uncharacterized protein (TIGR00369 family)